MYTNVIGFINSNNETYVKYKKIWEQCVDAEISLPKEVKKYFEYCEESEDKLRLKLPIKEWSNEYSSGFELLVKDIPEGVEKIRFYNSW